MATGADLWVDKVPEFSIDDGIARIRVVSGGTEIIIRCTPHTLLAGSSKAMRAYVEWDEAREDAVPLNGD
ncbi:MAG: hypothetical protein JWR80_9456 [Bradyrhizobium sp.]|nr:hypothetical protein [Bradyrhizobium sp.]